ncbi:hypothetical protein AXF42_Ash004899 [Apostasia shenzhenica]|uniref:Uncharacterized protein n=1 Tax=Apostasia shenzhenica TaxID=1088818 RepID=A0A2I0B7Y3_9ASPA|nr:hypothetical protein AXF42_Ash004899 [Apostasia shenzhenica]
MKDIPRPPHPSPALYATPAATPLPDSPSSFPFSPYLINHKRRGPRLLKSLSQPAPLAYTERKPETVDVSGESEAMNGIRVGEVNGRIDVEVDGNQGKKMVNGSHEEKKTGKNVSGNVDDETDLLKQSPVETEGDGEAEDFFDFLDSMSSASNAEGDESYGPERVSKLETSIGDYYDAYEEISSEGRSRASNRNIEDELREMRLNLLMELEKRKQAEEAVEDLQKQWQNLRQHLSVVGLVLPDLPTAIPETDNQSNTDPAEDLSQQITISRAVAVSISRAIARAEVEMEMEPQIEAKNFEISRLSDRLRYYEVANREMSQRNQEAIEIARQQRYRRKRRQKWIWGSIGLAATVGAAAIAWSYLPSSKAPATVENNSEGS